MFFADGLAFLAQPMEEPRREKGLCLNLALVTSVWPNSQNMTQVEGHNSRFTKNIRQFHQYQIVDSAANLCDIEKTNAADVNFLVLGMQNTVPDIDIPMVRALGIRVVAPAYSSLTNLGSGWKNMDIGLTDAGHKFVREMAQNRMIIDLSHCGHRTAREILQQIKEERLAVGVMASHGGCYSVYPHARNLPDDVLAGIAELGGFVGIATLAFILGPAQQDTEWVDDLLCVGHFKRAIQVCGNEAVGLGSDSYYVTVNEEEARQKFVEMKSKFDPDGALLARHPDHPYQQLNGPDKALAFAIQLGGSIAPAAAQVENLLGLNLLRFFREFLR